MVRPRFSINRTPLESDEHQLELDIDVENEHAHDLIQEQQAGDTDKDSLESRINGSEVRLTKEDRNGAL